MPSDTIATLSRAGLLMLAFTLKQFLADFLLQSDWMARGKEQASGWLRPLTAHAAVHAAMTLAIVLAVSPHLWWLGIVDFAVHATLDRGKSLVALKTRWSVQQTQFWWLVGLDQALHQATNIGLTGALLLL